MREIKFRAWKKECKSMVDVTYIDWNEKEVGYDEGDYFSFFISCILMQYTGLKDINNKEIYEGDIVAIDFMDMDSQLKKGVVTFIECGYCVDTGNSLIPLFSEIETKEVLGNIYENKELLEEL